MIRFTLIVSVVCGLMSVETHAAVVSRDWKTLGDGLLTYDTVSNREWLDLTETQLFKFAGSTLEESYQAVLAETAPGGMFAGFTVANREDIFALAESGGIDTTIHSPTVNEIPARELINLLGVTEGNLLYGSSYGTIGSIDGRTGDFLGNAVFNRLGFAGIEARRGGGLFGVWLYHPVPEPSTLLLYGIALPILLAFDGRSCHRLLA